MEAVPQLPFNGNIFETRAREWARDLKGGVTPTVDLRPYSHFDIAAVGEMLAFWIAAQEGKLGCGKCPPAKIILPEDERAECFLLKIKPFQFASSRGDVFWGVHDLARYEQDVNAAENQTRHGYYPFMPFTHVVKRTIGEKRKEFFENQCSVLLNRLVVQFHDALEQHLGFDRISVGEFWQPNKELLENIYFHSDSWGYAVIQTSKSGVVIFYADVGIGILRALEPQKEIVIAKIGRPWSEATAIEGAFVRGITGQPGKSRGDGLDVVKNYVQQNKGNITCRSGAAKVSFEVNGKVHRSIVEHIPGVQIRIYLPTKKHT